VDIAYYLSELLEQLGKVNVPGLGSFTRVKVDGYYNTDEGRVYPPTSKLEFTQQYADDDVLTQYIGVKKRISLASSKYFTEKYITQLKQEVMGREISFADLGTLYFSGGRIQFRSANTVSDPEFYGYPTISLAKKNAVPAYHYEEPVTEPEPVVVHEPVIEDERNEPSYEPFSEDDHLHEAVVADKPEIKEEQAEYDYIHPEERGQIGTVVVVQKDYFASNEVTIPYIEKKKDNYIGYRAPNAEIEEETYREVVEEEEEPSRNLKWLWICLIIIFVVAGGIFGWLYYQQQQQAAPVKKAKTAPVVAQKDTTDSASIKKDTVANKVAVVPPVQNGPASTIDSTKRRYEIIAASAQTQKEADKIVKNYKSIGIQAHIVTDAPGKRKKVSLGTYDSLSGVNAAINDLLKTGKVNKGIWPLPINPKK